MSNFGGLDLQVFTFFRQMIILSTEGIPAKNDQPDGDGDENSNDDNPDNGIVDVFGAFGVDVGQGSIYQFKNHQRRQYEKENRKISFKGVHG